MVMTGLDFLLSEWFSQALFQGLPGLHCYDPAFGCDWFTCAGFHRVTSGQVCVWISRYTVTIWPHLVWS
jgi:hypothetical protein